MSMEYTVVCDGCSAIICADRSVRRARAEAQLHCGAVSSGGKDWCRKCRGERMAEIAQREAAPSHSAGQTRR
jgi:hypothetical protein